MIDRENRNSRSSKLRNIALLTLLVVASLGLTVFVLEFAVRLLPEPYRADEGNVPLFRSQADLFVCDDKLGWAGAPDFRGVVELPGKMSSIAANAQGMHDTDHQPTKAPGTVRILMLGDSFVHAIQVEERTTSHQVLEDILNNGGQEAGLDYEVISGGMTGWGTAQELVYYREQGRDFQPDLVLLMLFLGNDLENNLPGNVLTIGGSNCYAPYFALCDEGLHPEPLWYAPGLSENLNNCSRLRRVAGNVMGALYRNSHLYQQLEPLIISLRPRQLFGSQYPNSFWALYIPNDEQELDQAWQVTQALVTQLRREVEADGAKFGVAFFPWSVIIESAILPPDQQAVILAENPIFSGIEIDRPNKHLAEFLSGEGISFIDLTSFIAREQAAQDGLLHFVGDGHWTVEGNRFVADTLANWIVQNGLIPQ